MNRYQIMLAPDLEETYKLMAEGLEMSVEQVLSSVVQIYAESLTYRTFDTVCNIERVRDYDDRRREDCLQ